MDYTFINIAEGIIKNDISLLFENWQPESESVVFFSPHDDDALLGAGYLLRLLIQMGVSAHVVIFCKGDAGYSDIGQKNEITRIRETETIQAYGILGLQPDRIHRFGITDFGLVRHLGWDGPENTGHLIKNPRLKTPNAGQHSHLTQTDGVFGAIIALLRDLKATRLIIPNGYREHTDHEAVHYIGRYYGVQANDPILADLGTPTVMKSVLVYSVWADFPPEDAVVGKRNTMLRANAGMIADESTETIVMQAVAAYQSQTRIINNLVEERQSRKCRLGYMELYQRYEPRPKLDYSPYVEWLNNI